MYIVFEGTVGTGKTTQAKKLFEYIKTQNPNKNIILTREPGGTEISEAIRKIVQGTKFNEEMNKLTDVYLYAAARAQSLRTVVKPVLDQGGLVISDRNFITSIAIQAFAQDNGLETVMNVNKNAIEGFIPDLVLYFDLDIEVGLARAFDDKGDKWESMGVEFYKKMYEGYKKASEMDMFKNKWVNIDASKSINEVFEQVKNAVKDYI